MALIKKNELQRLHELQKRGDYGSMIQIMNVLLERHGCSLGTHRIDYKTGAILPLA